MRKNALLGTVLCAALAVGVATPFAMPPAHAAKDPALSANSSTRSSEARPEIYNGLRHRNAEQFDRMGVLPVAVIYDVWDIHCTPAECRNVPSLDQFRATLRWYVHEFRAPSRIIIDFEQLTMLEATNAEHAQRIVDTLKPFIAATHEAFPDAMVGLYDYEWHPKYAEQRYVEARAQLYTDGGLDFFAPTMYQRWGNDPDMWDAHLQQALDHNALVADKPTLGLVTPDNYSGGGSQSSAEWHRQLVAVGTRMDGAVIWRGGTTGDVIDMNDEWVNVVRSSTATIRVDSVTRDAAGWLTVRGLTAPGSSIRVRDVGSPAFHHPEGGNVVAASDGTFTLRTQRIVDGGAQLRAYLDEVGGPVISASPAPDA